MKKLNYLGNLSDEDILVDTKCGFIFSEFEKQSIIDVLEERISLKSFLKEVLSYFDRILIDSPSDFINSYTELSWALMLFDIPLILLCKQLGFTAQGIMLFIYFMVDCLNIKNLGIGNYAVMKFTIISFFEVLPNFLKKRKINLEKIDNVASANLSQYDEKREINKIEIHKLINYINQELNSMNAEYYDKSYSEFMEIIDRYTLKYDAKNKKVKKYEEMFIQNLMAFYKKIKKINLYYIDNLPNISYSSDNHILRQKKKIKM